MKSAAFFSLLLAIFSSTAAVHALQRRDDLDSINYEKWPAKTSDGGKAWSSAWSKASSIVAEMTVDEKAQFITGDNGRCVGYLNGIDRLNISGICLEDGPVGIRPVHGASQFPAGLTTAATWDRDLMYQRSYAMGKEFLDEGVNIALAPVTGGPLGRSPLAGRNWEGWFVDPYATGEASYQSIKGLQDSGVAATSKHFIGYEQDTYRNQYNQTEAYSVFPAGEQRSISSNFDDKTTHEVYLWSFAEAVRAGAAYVMCSYNEVNQTQACNNAYTLNHLLKTELNFQGGIMSDWGGQHDDLNSMNGGMDISMPGSGWDGLWGTFWGDSLTTLVNNGSVTEDRLDDAVIRLLTPLVSLGQDTNPPPEVLFNAMGQQYFPSTVGYRNVRQASTAELIRQIGTDGITLLKNTGGLPVKNPQRIAVLGTDAGDNELGPSGCGSDLNSCSFTNNNGTLSMAGGSGYAYAPWIVSPLEAIQARVRKEGAEIGWVLNDTDYDSVTALVSTSDVTFVFVNDYSTEGRDRADISLDHSGDALIASAVNSSSNVVVVMHIPAVVDVEKWIDNENVTAVVAAWLPGEESGAALVPVLWGDVAPSGKLPFTWGKNLSDYPPNGIISDPVVAPQANFTEGVFIDYRWFDAKNITPRYEFGFGLSYTTFSYSNISLDSTFKADYTAIQETAEPFEEYDGTNSLYDVLATVSATVSNSGNVTGSEVAQLYVSIPESDQPPKVLRGFTKIKDLTPGSTGLATFELRRKDLSVWSVEKQTWYIPDGEFTISVGASSRDLPLTTTWSSS
ncbi:uncharacterized protein STEHIDRAFT_124824 [Stereum hirsutum FP-91666 SS1]|uniref:uncharacterized protein n=1 Tax=Stereum hirsutum (strain FP-91666) TaxID=721885 RepID=UPI0004449625|nr:uncharacterized protein STEHIDRAFT_124824 [Stereum hirsutum FP-91666 SS1]EIM82192.1 hypothetical protein STEHIDRAFT_124824 [Stereum hirsutum FP-91666 SS1]